MSATHIVEITCDAPGCGKQHIEEGTASWVRELSAAAGWTITRHHDFCPAHEPKTARKRSAASSRKKQRLPSCDQKRNFKLPN